jgi:hypothetical protein
MRQYHSWRMAVKIHAINTAPQERFVESISLCVVANDDSARCEAFACDWDEPAAVEAVNDDDVKSFRGVLCKNLLNTSHPRFWRVTLHKLKVDVRWHLTANAIVPGLIAFECQNALRLL